jgi:hypothetical protein
VQAWINTSAKTVSRAELLSEINSLSQAIDREGLLKRHGFFKVRGNWQLYIWGCQYNLFCHPYLCEFS